jgi:hypothetical protein
MTSEDEERDECRGPSQGHKRRNVEAGKAPVQKRRYRHTEVLQR